MSDVIAKTEHVSVERSGVQILDDVSMSICRGEIVAIIGPNGAGKTTFMKCLLGLTEFSGKIEWKKGVRVGYVPQKVLIPKSFPLTTEELFALKEKKSWFKASLKKQDWLARVGGEHLRKKRIADLSGGELQRVLIAYALAGDVDVLCLDEPSAGIDIGGGQTVYGLINDLHAQDNMTVVLISHDLDVVFRYADQVLCIDKRTICNGRPASVLTPEAIERMYGKHASVYPHHGQHAHDHNHE